MKERESIYQSDMQYKDNLRRDKFFNDLIIELLEEGKVEKALDYLKQNNQRMEKTLEE